MFGLSNPYRFLKFTHKFRWVLFLLMVVFFVKGLGQSLYLSPPDYQQGDSVRIMYVHVPAAWLSLFIYTSMAVAAFTFLVFKHNLAALYCRAAAPLGIMFTAICLMTGSLWGKAMWGAYWVWDARLTSMLILFFLYLGYWILKDAYDRPEKGEKMAAILLLIGVVNIPIIKFSVEWFQTLHQPASLKPFQASSIHPSILEPLLWMAAAFFVSYAVLVLWRIEILFLEKKSLRKVMKNKYQGGEHASASI